MRLLIVMGALLLTVANAFADVSYDRDKNAVIIPSSFSSPDIGWITIFRESYVEIVGTGLDATQTKTIGMCGVNPSLGIMFLDGKLAIAAKVPAVTDVGEFPASAKSRRDLAEGGWVPRYILKGEDALDLMDLLHTYESVGFAIFSDTGCYENKHFTQGELILNFNTQGLERGMRRLR